MAVLTRRKADLRQLDEGAGAVRQPETERRQAVLLDAGHFAEGARMSIGQEHRIVAEAGGAARRPHQRSVGARLDFLEMIVGPGDAQRGDEMRLAPLRGVVAPRSCSRRSIRVIAAVKSLFGPAQRAEKIPGAPSSASTTSPESSAKAGSCAALAAATALIRALAPKAVAGLVGLAEAELAGRYRLDAVRRQQFAHLGELAGIVGRDHELAGDSAVHGSSRLTDRHGRFSLARS